MTRLYVGGPSGCGKTVVCKNITNNLGISCFTGSELMVKAAGVSTKDELDLLPEDIKNDLRLNSFKKYCESTQDLIMDGHFYLTENDINNFDAYILIEIDQETLINFRSKDETRQRTVEPIEIETEIIQINKRVQDLENQYGIKIITIKNNDTMEHLSKNIENIYLSLSSIETRREIEHHGKEIR